MLLSLINKRFILFAAVLMFACSAIQANVCDQHLSQITSIPFEKEPGDAHYRALMAAGRSAVPCLVANVTNTRRLRNPRPIPAGTPTTMIGDVAVYLLAEATGLDPIKLLPRKYRDDYPQMGVIVMDIYLHDRRSHPRALQRRLWRWYRTTYLPSLRKGAT